MAAEICLKDGSILTVEQNCREIAKIDNQNAENGNRIYTFINLTDYFTGLDILIPKMHIKYVKDIEIC